MSRARRRHGGRAFLALEAEIGDVDHEQIAVDAFVLATPEGHPLGEKEGHAKPNELRDVSVLLLDDGHCFRKQALAVCWKARARELEFRATSLATLAQMVAGGAGLRLREFVEPVPHRTIALAWRKRSPLGPALRQLAATIRSSYPQPERLA